MKRDISVVLQTQDYRGDHSADVQVHFRVKDNETVAELMERVFPVENARTDWLELRIINR